jgi:8-oxo-dGTP pyrophosphatase MutT (NUDIX family)
MDHQRKFLDGIACMLIKDQHVLVEKRKLTRQIAPGALALPGGHMQAGESPEEALHRGLREALNIAPARMAYVCTLLHHAQEFRRLHYFVVEAWHGDISHWEAGAMLWMPLTQVHRLDLAVDRVAISEYRRVSHSTCMPRDNQSYRFPVSVKGVVLHIARVALLRNEREEWELPGGKLELGESPEACVTREIHEELGLHVTTGPLLDSWVYHIAVGVDVLILTYGCYTAPFATVTHSPEHKAVGLFTLQEVQTLRMPEGYKKSIRSWAAQQTGST